MITYDYSKPDNNVHIKKAFPKDRMSCLKEKFDTLSSNELESDSESESEFEEIISNAESSKLVLKDNFMLKNPVRRNDDDDQFDINSISSASSQSKALSNGRKKEKEGTLLKIMALKMMKSEIKSQFGEISSFIFQKQSMINVRASWTNTKQFEFFHSQYVYNCSLQCLFSIMTMASSVIEYELSVFTAQDSENVMINHVNNTNIENYNISRVMVQNSIRSGYISSVFTSVISVCLWVSIVFDFLLSCKIGEYLRRIQEPIWRKDIKNILLVALTIIIYFPHPSPITHGIIIQSYNQKYQIDIEIPLNAYLTSIVLFRMWFIVKFLLVTSIYYNPRTQRICNMNYFTTSLWCSLKCIMVKRPYVFNIFIFIIILLICSYSIRIFERDLQASTTSGLGNYYNAIWCVFITMATVGYGDYSPGTSFGRVFAIVGCFFGVFSLSLVVVAVSNVLNLRGNERSIFLVLERVDLMAEKDRLASRFLSRFLKMHKKIKRNPQTKKDKKMSVEVVKELNNFKEKCAEISSTFPPYSNFDNIIDNLIFLEHTVTSFGNKFKKMEKTTKAIIRLLNLK